MNKSGLFAAFVIGVAFSLPAHAKLYKWVDDQGVTHYGETIPPEYANKDRAELGKSGRVIKKEEVLTAEERSAEREASEKTAAKKREEEKSALERARRDQTLINTYSNVGEIDLARKRNLQQIELRINSINAQLKIVGENLQNLQKETEDYNKASKKIPVSLMEDLKETQARLDKLSKDLEKPMADKTALEARFDADKARYRELTGK